MRWNDPSMLCTFDAQLGHDTGQVMEAPTQAGRTEEGMGTFVLGGAAPQLGDASSGHWTYEDFDGRWDEENMARARRPDPVWSSGRDASQGGRRRLFIQMYCERRSSLQAPRRRMVTGSPRVASRSIRSAGGAGGCQQRGKKKSGLFHAKWRGAVPASRVAPKTIRPATRFA